MFDLWTAELLSGGGLIGLSGLVAASGVMIYRSPKEKDEAVDLDAAIRDAPYHRLHNIIPVSG